MTLTQEQIEALRFWSESALTRKLYRGDTPLSDTLADVVETLSQARAAPAGVRVKKWDGHKSMYQYRIYPIGAYNDKRESVFLDRDEFGCRVQIAKSVLPHEARKALQADYEARILSALEPAPGYREGYAAALEAAADRVGTLRGRGVPKRDAEDTGEAYDLAIDDAQEVICAALAALEQGGGDGAS